MAMTLASDLEKVLEFMEGNVEKGRLVLVAKAAAALAPVLWADDFPLGRDSVLTFRPESRHEQLSTATQ
jgi:hypothetical protein